MSAKRKPGNFRWLVAAHQGHRDNQQDGCAVEERGDAVMGVICDGAGGHSGGAQASRAAADAAARVFRKADLEARGNADVLLRIAEEANNAVTALAHGVPRQSSPRSTIAVLILQDHIARWVHIGDSRIYRLRNGRILGRTLDHSVVQMLVSQGAIGEGDMGTHPDQGRLLRVLGGEEALKPTLGELPLQPNDAFFICSDGFWERCSNSEIENFFPHPTQEGLDELVAEAVRRNGNKSDNVTVAAFWTVSPHPPGSSSRAVPSSSFAS